MLIKNQSKHIIVQHWCFNFIELTHLCMDKSIIAYPLKILVSIEIFDLKVPFFTIFLYIGYGPLTQ